MKVMSFYYVVNNLYTMNLQKKTDNIDEKCTLIKLQLFVLYFLSYFYFNFIEYQYHKHPYSKLSKNLDDI